MQIKRTILLFSLVLVLFMLWNSWVNFSTNAADQQANNQTVNTADGSVQSPSEDLPAVATDSASLPTVNDQKSQVKSGVKITVNTDVVVAEIDTLGGDITYLGLKKYPVSVDTPDVPYPLLHDNNGNLFVVQGRVLGDNGQEHLSQNIQYQSAQTEYQLGDADHIDIPLNYVDANGVRYTKIYRFKRDSYHIDVIYNIDNQSAEPWNGFLFGQMKQTEKEDEGSLGFLGKLPSYRGAVYYTDTENFQKYDYGDMVSENLSLKTNNGWVAMIEHYFVAAMLLKETPGPYEFYTRVSNNNQYRIGFASRDRLTVEPGASGTLQNSLFVGPKDQKRLEAQNVPGLLLTVDYGWLTPVAEVLFWVLSFIYSFVKNWGWAIILLTLLIKLIFYPLSAKSYKSMAKMRKLQPRMQTLKERYGDDRQKFQQELMKIYKTEKVNPASGCLPILVQIPVFLALYWVLLESVELRQADFIFWYKDLSLPDPYFVLPLLMGASMFVQQKLNPAPLDPMQQKIMTFLPIVFTVFFLWFPAGLVLYWVVNNILSITQQYIITRKYADK